MKNSKILVKTVIPAAILALQARPESIGLNFFGTDGAMVSHCSYFSFLPIGYANFAPVCTVAVTVTLLFAVLFGGKKLSLQLICCTAALLLTLLPLAMGIYAVTAELIGILLLYLLFTAMLVWERKK